MPHKPAKIISFLLCFLLIFEQSLPAGRQVASAQAVGQLDISSHILSLRNSLIQDKFRPLHLRYLSYDNVNNNFKLLLDKGDWQKGLSSKGTVPDEQDLEGATKTLLNYFFIGITLPNDSFWVNLRPDSPDNIIDSALAMTDVGKILLEADLQLKKDTAKFTSPETVEGKKYWAKLYQKAEELFGTSNITIPTLTRPWIVPGEIIIREAKDNAYIYKATLKVCLEQDYLKDSATYNFKDERLRQLNEYSSQLIRELIIPKLTREINCSKRYASLRQVYYSLILAQWFKQKFYGKGGLYASLIDRHNLTGLTSKTDWSKTAYFKEYQKSFKDGEYNIEEQVSSISGKTFRTYFSGGISFMGEAIKAGLGVGGTIKVNPKRIESPRRKGEIGIEIKGGNLNSPGEINITKKDLLGTSDMSQVSVGTYASSKKQSSLGAQVSHIKNLDNLLRILNIFRKSENVPEIAENASNRDIIEFCIKYLEAKGLITTTTDEDGNVIITINNNALNHPDETVRRFVEVIQRWVINPEGGVKAVNFQGKDDVWMIIGFESELQNKDTLEHEQKEIKFRKQGLSWIEAHNQAVAEAGKGQKIDKEEAVESGAGRQDEIGAEVGLPKEQAIKQINELKKAIQMGKHQQGAVVDLRGIPADKEIILVGDLHTRLDNLKKVLSQNGNLEKIQKGEAVLVILGDAVHGEIDYREMDSSIGIMQFIMGLKIDNPDNVYYLLGNHDYLSGNFTKNNVPQGSVYRNRIEELYGKEYVALYEDFIKASPLIVIGNGFIGVHGGPIKGATLEEIQKVNVADEKNHIVNHAEWGRYKDKEVGYDEEDVQEFLENMGQADGFLIVGHSPHHIPPGKFFARLCENHYVIFAGREQAGYAVMQAGKIGFVEVTEASPVLELGQNIPEAEKQDGELSIVLSAEAWRSGKRPIGYRSTTEVITKAREIRVEIDAITVDITEWNNLISKAKTIGLTQKEVARVVFLSQAINQQLEEAIKAKSGGKQNSALSEEGNEKEMKNQWVPSNESCPVPYETDLEKWQKSRSLDLESLPQGTLVYLGDTGTWVNYLIRIEKDGELKLWLNGNDGCYIGTAELLHSINGAKGKIDADEGIGFPYFKWDKEGLLNLDNRTPGERWWMQSFPFFRVLYAKDYGYLSKDKVNRIGSSEGELNTKNIGGQRNGGISETFFVENAWIAAGKFIYKIWVEADRVFFRRYEKDKITPIGGIHIVSLDQQIQIGREIGYYILPSDMTLSSKHFLFRVSRAENGKFMLRVEDLKSLNGTVVEWNEPQDFELDDPGKGPGAASRLELPNNKVKEAKELLRKGKMLDARWLLEGVIEDYQRIIMDYGGTEGQAADPFLQAAKKNIMIAQMLLDKIPGKEGHPLSIHKKEIGLQGSNIDALINYHIQRWSKWLQDSRDRLKTLNPEQIPAVIIENEEKLARERENVLSRTLELKNIMKSDNIREFVRALKEVRGGAEKELSSRQKIILATITKELKGHPYIDFNPEEILFIPASSWLHDFFEFKGVCGRIMAINDGTNSGNIILIDESRNKSSLELLNTLIHEIIHKQFRNGGGIIQQARPQERRLFRVLEEALTERLAMKLTQDIYRRNPQINVKSPEEKLFEIIYGEETAYLSKSYPMEGRFLEEVLKALGGNAEEAIFDCLKTGDLTLLRDLLGSRWEKIVAVIESADAKSDFYDLGLYIITRSINDNKGERGLDASIKALNIMKKIDIWDVLGEKVVELFNFNPSGELMSAIVSRAGVKLLDEILGANAADFDSKDIKDKFIEYVKAATLKFIRLKVDFDKARSRKLPSARTFANYQIGKLAKAEITPDKKLKVTDSKGNVSVLDLKLQGELDIASLKSQIESMLDIEHHHRQVILSILSLLEKSPPKFFEFSTLIEDLFGLASSEHNLIALHQGISDNPVALFHEIAEYLISSGVLDIRLEGDVLMVSFRDKKIGLLLEEGMLAIANKDPDNPHYLLRALQREVFKHEDWELTWQIKENQAGISKQLAASSLINIYQAMVDMYGSEQALETMLPKMNILEIGPGDKTDLISLLKSKGTNIVGVDLSYVDFPPKTIESGLVKKVKGGAAEYLKGVKPGTSDIIYSNHVLETGNPSITRGEIREILISSKEALKDNGYIIIQVFDEFGAPSEEELRTLGFIIKRSESLDEGRHYLWVLQKAPQVDNGELRQIIAKFEGQIEVYPDDVAQYVPEEIKIIFDVAKELGLALVLTGGTARDFAIASHLKRKLPMPVLSDIDIAIIPEESSEALGNGDWAKEKYELLNEELRKRGYTYKIDFSAGVRTQDTYVFENFTNTKSSSAFGLSRLAAAWAGNKYVIFGTNEAVNDLKNKVLSADIEKAEAPGEGMAAKMIGKAAIYRDFADFVVDNYLKESLLKDVNLVRGQGKDAIVKFIKDIFGYMKVNDKNDDPAERLRKTIREFDLSGVLGFSEEELIKLAQGERQDKKESSPQGPGGIDGSTPGGIDFRALPIVSQSMPPVLTPLPLGAQQVGPLAGKIKSASEEPDKEWQQIERMVGAGIIPSAERIKEYLLALSLRADSGKELEKVIVCISDILRIEEERCSLTEPALKDILVSLESTG